MNRSPNHSPPRPESGMATRVYQYRWLLSALVLSLIAFAFTSGFGRNAAFSAQVDSLQETPPDETKPKLFDARYDIWFDPEDPGLVTYKEIEERFVAEDFVLVAFEEKDEPLGVFSKKALETIAQVTARIEKVPFVRHVRSLTSNPWIRWDTIDGSDEGLLITDFFEGDPTEYSRPQVLERVVAVLGAERAAKLVGEEAVRSVIGKDAKFEDYIGEPRLLGNVISEDGRTAAFQVLVLRPRIDAEVLQKTFGDDEASRVVGRSMHANWAQWNALHEVEDAIDKLGKGYDFHLAGMPLVERNFMETGERDMGMVLWMFVMIALVTFLLFRRVAALLTPMLIIFASILGMLGTVLLQGDLLNNITAAAPNMVTAIAIADAIHLIASYYILRPRYGDKAALITEVIRRNAMPVFLTTLTTAIGFFSLTTGNIIPLRMLGYTAGLGTILAYLASMAFVPAILSLLPLKQSATEQEDESATTDAPHWSDPLLAWVMRRRVAIAVTSLVVTALAVYGVTQLRIDSDFRTMFPDSNVTMVDMNWIEDRLGGSGDLEFVFEAPARKETDEVVSTRQSRIEELRTRQLGAQENVDGLQPLAEAERGELAKLLVEEADRDRRRIATNARFLERLRDFNDRLRSEMKDPKSPLRAVTRLDGALDILRKMHQVQNRNQAAFYRPPTEDDVHPEARKPQLVFDEITEESEYIPAQDASTLAAQYYLQYENGAKPAENLSTLVSPDRRLFRVQGRVQQESSLTQQAAFDRIREIAATEFPELAGTPEQVESGEALSTMTLSGKTLLYAGMSDKFAKSFITSMLVALTIITLLIALIYRSIKMGALSIVPNVLPIFIPIGFFGLFGWDVDGPAVFVSSVALGICVDDTIHFFTKFTRARKRGLGLEASLSASFREVGNALTFTTIILILGFGVLAFSEFSPNSMMGKLAALMIGLAWLADFVVTPALLTFLPASAEKRSPETAEKTEAANAVVA